jgi:hypothetical protein
MPGKIMEGGAMSDTFGYLRGERDNGLARMRSRERVRLILTRVGVAVLLIWFVSSWYVDAMAVSGFLTAFVGLWLSTYIESGFARTMSRLQADRVFGPDVAKIEDVVLTLERHASRTQQFLGGGCGHLRAGGIFVLFRQRRVRAETRIHPLKRAYGLSPASA